MEFLSTAENVFEIEGRGCVIDTGLSESALSRFHIRRQDPILLRRPNGSTVATRVHGFDFLYGPNRRSRFAIEIPPNLTKADVPVGTEIFLTIDLNP